MTNIRNDVCEWIDSGPGSAAVRLVKDYAHRKEVLDAVADEVEVQEGELKVWEDPAMASAQLPSLTPEHDAVVVLVNAGQAPPWADWLRANREGFRDTIAFLLVLIFESDFSILATHSPDFMSWAKENSPIRWAMLPEQPLHDANAECLEETGMDLYTLRERWISGQLEDTQTNSSWVGIAVALLGTVP